MKSMPAVVVLAVLATCAFAIERITAAESAASATGACTGCCEKSCSGEQACCKQGQAAAAACPASEVQATVASTSAATAVCGGQECPCQCEASCCEKQAATSVGAPTPGKTAGIPHPTIAKAFVATQANECSTCSNCKSECATACATELQNTGLDPYRIEPPDVLSVYVPMIEPKCADVREKMSAKGISFDIQLPFSNVECEGLVGVDGRIAIQGIGEVYVSGMTVEEAQWAIRKKILEACPRAKQAAFGVIVDVSAANSKRYYVIIRGAGSCDNVTEAPITGNETVLDAFSRIGGISKAASAKIWIARPAPNGAGCEQILPVNWEEITHEGNTATNYQLLPGDRLHVELANDAPAPPVPPTPAAAAVLPIELPPPPYYSPRPITAAQQVPPIAPTTSYCPSAPPAATYYAAFPEPVPSPFARQAGLPSPPLIATQAFVSTSPLQAPPAPAAAAPQCAGEAGACCAGTCSSCPACTTSQADSAAKVAQVQFAVQVIEDHTGSMKEFKALQGDMPILTANSEVILPAIRILEKQRLVRRLSSPQLMAIVNQEAQIQIGSEVPKEGSAKPSFHGLMLKTAARELGGGLNVDFQFRDTTGSDALEVETSLLVSHGQTIVMKTTGRHAEAIEVGEQKSVKPAVYVVLTPELIK